MGLVSESLGCRGVGGGSPSQFGVRGLGFRLQVWDFRDRCFRVENNAWFSELVVFGLEVVFCLERIAGQVARS